jgi:hypothetical protein
MKHAFSVFASERSVAAPQRAYGLRGGLLRVVTNGDGHWQVNGRAATHPDGCCDIDLESSAMTNTIPVHRIAAVLGVTQQAARERFGDPIRC